MGSRAQCLAIVGSGSGFNASCYIDSQIGICMSKTRNQNAMIRVRSKRLAGELDVLRHRLALASNYSTYQYQFCQGNQEIRKKQHPGVNKTVKSRHGNSCNSHLPNSKQSYPLDRPVGASRMHDIVGEDHVDLYEKKQEYKEEAEEEAEEDHLSPSYAPVLTSYHPNRMGRWLEPRSLLTRNAGDGGSPQPFSLS